MAEHKVLGYLLAIGLCIVAAIFWVLDDEKATSEDTETSTVAVAPPGSSEDDAATGAVSGGQTASPQITGEPLDEALAGKVLVSKRPVQVLAAPSESASAMFGFPAGRPFRAISKQDGFVRIQDVRSGASGWIEEAALAPAPTKPVAAPAPTKPVAAPPSSTPSRKSAGSGGSKPSEKRPAPDTETAAAEPEPAPQRKRRGLFGGGGLFGGLFGGGR